VRVSVSLTSLGKEPVLAGSIGTCHFKPGTRLRSLPCAFFSFQRTARKKNYPPLSAERRRYPTDSAPSFPSFASVELPVRVFRVLRGSTLRNPQLPVPLLPKKNRTRDNAGQRGTTRVQAGQTRQILPGQGGPRSGKPNSRTRRPRRNLHRRNSLAPASWSAAAVASPEGPPLWPKSSLAPMR
jgi:hypothetical protein